MKKLILMLMAVLILLSGCRRETLPETSGPETTQTEAPVQDNRTLEELINAIYAEQPMPIMTASVPVDLQDEWAVKSYTGLDSSENIREAVASESMIGAQAYSLVLVLLRDGADAQSVAQQMRDGIDQRKWVCAYADDLMVSGKNDLVMLVMIDSTFADEGATAQSLTDAFQTAVGGTLDFTLK